MRDRNNSMWWSYGLWSAPKKRVDQQASRLQNFSKQPLLVDRSIRRDTYLEIGGFDDRLFLYCEDADLSMRALSAGWKINIVPEACILHKIHGSMGEKALRINSYYVNRNRLFLIFKLYATKPMKLFLLTTYFIFSRSVKFMLLMLCGRIACGLLLFEGVVDALKANMFRRKRAF